jgi:hypothetical protein
MQHDSSNQRPDTSMGFARTPDFARSARGDRIDEIKAWVHGGHFLRFSGGGSR